MENKLYLEDGSINFEYLLSNTETINKFESQLAKNSVVKLMNVLDGERKFGDNLNLFDETFTSFTCQYFEESKEYITTMLASAIDSHLIHLSSLIADFVQDNSTFDREFNISDSDNIIEFFSENTSNGSIVFHSSLGNIVFCKYTDFENNKLDYERVIRDGRLNNEYIMSDLSLMIYQKKPSKDANTITIGKGTGVFESLPNLTFEVVTVDIDKGVKCYNLKAQFGASHNPNYPIKKYKINQ